MQSGHRPWRDAAREPIAHHQIGPGVQGVYERPEVVECIAVVGVGDDHVPPARHADALRQGGAVSVHGDIDHLAAVDRVGDLTGSVGAPVVGDDDLVAQPEFARHWRVP